MKCHCADPGCPHCRGYDHAIVGDGQTLFRIDMEDYTGTDMCDTCASDAMESGVFRTEDQVPEVWCTESGSMGVEWNEPELELKVSEGFGDTFDLLKRRAFDE